MPSNLSVPLYAYWPNGISWIEEDHFTAGLGNLTGRGTASGTGATSALNTTTTIASRPGTWNLNCGTAAAALASLGFPGLHSFANGQGKFGFRSIFNPNTLFTAGNTGQLFWGFWPTVIAGTAPASGVYFQYDTAISATIPNAVVSGAGTSSVSTGVTLVANTWYDSLILVDNTAMTVEFYLTPAVSVNGAAPYFGAPVSTFTMPSNLASGMQVGFSTIKGAVGATSVQTQIDFWSIIHGQSVLTLTGASLLSMN